MKKVYAYYFPNWHPTSLNDEWHGKGWTEWEVVKHATPRFEGHIQPKIPIWGYEDESKPEVMEKKIEAASSHGVDGFIFDWYWYNEGPYRIDCLDKGFLGAKNNKDIEFAVMWCNHDLGCLHPKLKAISNALLASGRVSEETFIALTNHCINNYFKRKNYIKIDGKPLFIMYSLSEFLNAYGKEKCIELLADFRERARKAKVGEIHISLCETFYDLNEKELPLILKDLKIDGINSYIWDMTDAFPTVEYKDIIERNVKRMKDFKEKYEIPFVPTVSAGWDSSPRTVQSEIYGNYGYPFCAVVVGNTPEYFERALNKMGKLVDDKNKYMTISCWNEWTEGAYLEPCTQYGFGMLNAVKRFKENF